MKKTLDLRHKTSSCGARRDDPNATRSRAEWHRRLYEAAARRMEPGEEGFHADVALSHSPKSRQRREAVLRLAMRNDPRGQEHIERLLSDPDARTRRQAMVALAMAIHPAQNKLPLDRAGSQADTVPVRIEALLARANDPNGGNRKVLAWLLADYAPLADKRVKQVLQRLGAKA